MDKKKQEDVLRLIASLNRNADETFKKNIIDYAEGFFNSSLGIAPCEQPSFWANRIKTKISQNYDLRGQNQCEEACAKFLSNTAITKKAQILKMLYKLSQQVSNSSSLFNTDLSQASSQKSNIKKSPPLNQTQASFTNPRVSSASNSYSHSQSNVYASSNVNANVPINKPMPDQLKQIRFRGSFHQGISQSNILKQITYRLQGIQTDLIGVDSLGQGALKANVQVSETVRRIVRDLSEIGWLYQKIIDKNSEDKGAISRALKLGVQEQISEYYRWLSVIQKMIKQQGLNLRKMILWSYEPFQKLKWMAIVLEAAKPFQGCQIISIINSYRPQGSNSINQLLNRLLTHLLQPLFQYIVNWVYKGELIDSDGEFFICMNKGKNSDGLKECFQWSRKFYLDEYNIPNLLDYDSAVKIFNAGKTIYFLKNHCKIDYKLQLQFFQIRSALNNKLYESTSILSADFKTWLSNVSKVTNDYLIQVMFNKFDLKKHFNAIKMFYLAGKGDFIQALIDSLKEELSKPKSQIAEHNLQRFISDAIAQSFPKVTQVNSLTNGRKIMTIQQQIIARLTAKKVENGQDGWDVFNFQYSVEEPPLNTVFSQPVIERYQKIFTFLWKVKRVEQTLKESWLSSAKDYTHELKLPILHECQILRQQMFHFVNNLLGYLMISIESAWDLFTDNLNKAKSFDEILKFQENLIQELIQITLNTPKAKMTSSSLVSVFSTIITFASHENSLIKQFSDFIQSKREYTIRRNLIKKGLQFGEELEAPYFNPSGVLEKLKQMPELYRKTFGRFYDQIKKDPEGRINTLAFRLDFSGFYSSQAEQNA